MLFEFIYIFLLTGLLEFSMDPNFYFYSVKSVSPQTQKTQIFKYQKTPTIWQKYENCDN